MTRKAMTTMLRDALSFGCVFVLGAVLAATAHGQGYPTRPLRLLVPFTPGGSQDVAARLISAPVARSLGQNVVIDNRAGSGGLIAAQEAARAQADGYTLFMASGAQMGISPALRSNVGYDPVKSFIHVIHLTDTPMSLIAHPALPASNAKELVAYSLANRGKLNTASTGNGTYTHMTLELFKQITGADLTHVPYK
ncbi:MAG: ABC transporter substrate-binding protein, partial [Betaproteobacteria bacterium]